ncbi:MAG TPA: AI-2E family transporter [Candidatus Acidoferrales bacterium]|nr:AI-2E family transporter [Candidatus Acidoferrales bacterium]
MTKQVFRIPQLDQFGKARKGETAVLTRRTSTIVLLSVLLCLSLIIAGILFRFFWRPIVFAAVIGIAFYPVHQRIEKLLSRQNVSALISTLMVLFICIVSGVFFASAVSNEIMHAAQYIGGGPGQGIGVFSNLFHSADSIISWLEKYVDLEKTGLRSAIDSLPAKMSQLLFSAATTLVTGLAGFLGQGVVTLFILFFVFRDGASITVRAAAMLPVDGEHLDRLFARIRDSVFANLYGILAVAFGQGLLTGVVFAILGIPSPILFGIAAAILSLVPVVGPSLVWLPASAFLFATGHWMKALFLIAWGAAVVGLADNIIRPLVIMGRVRLHPLILLFALVGGVRQFGFAGLFIGPVAMSVILPLADMLQEQFGKAKREPAAIGP